MKILVDFFPVILFFVAYKLYGIYVATAVAIAASFVQVGYGWWRHRRVENMHLATLGILVVFGGLTILLQDRTFIMWKPTVLYWAFAAVLLGADMVFGRNLMRAMMEKQISLPDPIWRRLNLSWVGFFLLMGVLNLYVAFNFSEETWVSFKMFGGLGLMLVFVLAQGFFLSRHVEERK